MNTVCKEQKTKIMKKSNLDGGTSVGFSKFSLFEETPTPITLTNTVCKEHKLSFAEFIAVTENPEKPPIGAQLKWAEDFIKDCATELYHNGDCTNEIHSCRLCVLERELNDYYEYCKKNNFIKI